MLAQQAFSGLFDANCRTFAEHGRAVAFDDATVKYCLVIGVIIAY